MTEEKIPQMLTMRECAKRSGLSYYAIRGMVSRNEIPHIYVGRTVFVNFDWLVGKMRGNNDES